MDFVPKDTRNGGSPSTVHCVFRLVGAVLGGYLADKYDYSFIFMITAVSSRPGRRITYFYCLWYPSTKTLKRSERGYTALNDPGNYRIERKARILEQR